MATYYYIGGDTGSSQTASDWSATSGGAALTTAPTWGPGDEIVVDSDAEITFAGTTCNGMVVSGTGAPVLIVGSASSTAFGSSSAPVTLPNAKLRLAFTPANTKGVTVAYMRITSDQTAFDQLILGANVGVHFTSDTQSSVKILGDLKALASINHTLAFDGTITTFEICGSGIQFIQARNESAGTGFADTPIWINKTTGDVHVVGYAINAANSAHDTVLVSGAAPFIRLGAWGSALSLAPIQLNGDLVCSELHFGAANHTTTPEFFIEISAGKTLTSSTTVWEYGNIEINGADTDSDSIADSFGTYCTHCTDNTTHDDAPDSNYNVAAGITKTCLVPAAPAPTPLNVPANLNVAATSAHRLTPTFETVANAVSYTLEYTAIATDDIPDWTNGTTAANFVSGTAIADLTTGTPYYFRVKAVGDAVDFADSDWSQIATQTPAIPVLNPPTHLNAKPFSKNKIVVTFTPSPGALSHTIQYGTTSDFSNAVTTTNFVSGSDIFALAGQTRVYIRLWAVGDGTDLLDSAKVVLSATTLADDRFIVLNNNDSGTGSLRQAIIDADSESADTLITFDSTLSGATITLLTGLEITKSLRIDASALLQTLTLAISNDIVVPSTLASDEYRCCGVIAITNTNAVVGLKKLRLTGGRGFYFSAGAIATSSGGGLLNLGTATLEHCIVTNNSAGRGAGIAHCGTTTLLYCTVTHNTASMNGAAVYETSRFWSFAYPTSVLFSATNSLFCDNVCTSGNLDSNFAVVEMYTLPTSSGRLVLTNCTLCRNTNRYNSPPLYVIAGGKVTLNNCIILAESTERIIFPLSDSGMTASIVGLNNLAQYTGWSQQSANNVVYNDSLPLFADDAHEDYTLCANSQAIGIGDPTLIQSPLDLAGNPRVQDESLDVGCYEFVSAAPTELPVPANLTASICSSSEITLSWNAVANAAGYLLRWTADSETPVYQYASCDSNSLSAIAGNLELDTLYHFQIQAHGSGAYSDSDWSPAVSESTPADENYLNPVVTLLGNSYVQIQIGNYYIDPGATAVDWQNQPLDVSVTGAVHTNIAGTYSLLYSAVDSLGLTGSATRVLVVVSPEVIGPVPPLWKITLGVY